MFPTTTGRPHRPTARERFDRITLEVVDALEARWADRLGLIEYAVEDVPDLAPDWQGDGVPLASLVRGRGATPTRLVLFRRPIEHRVSSPAELRTAVLTVVVDQIADLLGLPAEDVHPGYDGDADLG